MDSQIRSSDPNPLYGGYRSFALIRKFVHEHDTCIDIMTPSLIDYHQFGLASWVKGGWSILMLALQVHRGNVQVGGYVTLP